MMPTIGNESDLSPEAMNEAIKRVEKSLVMSCGTTASSKKASKMQKAKSKAQKTATTTKSSVHSVMSTLESSFKGKYGKAAKVALETSGKKLASFSQ